MRKALIMSMLGLFVITVSSPAMADDNKLTEGVKTIGKGLAWGPKKLWAGTKKGFEAMGNGAKKIMGK